MKIAFACGGVGVGEASLAPTAGSRRGRACPARESGSG